MLGGLVLIAVGLLLMPAARTLPPLLMALSALAIGMGATQPSINSLVSRRAGPEQQGEIMGVAQAIGSLSRVLGPIVAGALFGAFGRHSPFLLGAVLVAGALLVGWRLPRGIVAVAAPPETPLRPPLGPAR